MSRRSWTLSGRLTLWISALATGPLILAFALGGMFLHHSVAREVESLVEEELEEARAWLRDSTNPVADLVPLTRNLGAQHADTPMAWQLLESSTGNEIKRYGQTDLLRSNRITLTTVIGPLDGQRFHGVAPLSEIHHLRVVLDGAERFSRLKVYWAWAALIFVVCGAVAVAASHALARHIAALVRRIGDGVGAAEAVGSRGPQSPDTPAELRQVADTIQAKFGSLREEAHRIQVFTAGLAHELRSPVQNLIGQTEVALANTADPASHRRFLHSQLDELSGLADAVDNLLTICTIEARPDGATERFDLAEESRLRLLREQERAERREIQLRISATGDTIVAGNREHALRGIRNVVANAVDWTPSAGTVNVTIRGESEQVVVTVDDSGPGVQPADYGAIFEPFVQGTGRSKERTGYGLGLAIARAAVEAHSGQIRVASSPLGGARFELVYRKAAAANGDAPKP